MCARQDLALQFTVFGSLWFLVRPTASLLALALPAYQRETVSWGVDAVAGVLALAGVVALTDRTAPVKGGAYGGDTITNDVTKSGMVRLCAPRLLSVGCSVWFCTVRAPAQQRLTQKPNVTCRTTWATRW